MDLTMGSTLALDRAAGALPARRIRMAVKGLPQIGGALTHQYALSLLGLSLAIAAALLAIPALRPLSDRAIWVLELGAVTYAVAVVVLLLFPGGRTYPDLESVEATRNAIGELAREQAQGERAGALSPLAASLEDSLDQLDHEIMPTLRQVLIQADRLGRQLARYDSGRLPMPDEAFMQRLHALHARLIGAAGECARQTANAHAALVVLLREGDDDRRIEAQARELAGGLLEMHDVLADLLQGGGSDAVPELGASSLQALPEDTGQAFPREVENGAMEITTPVTTAPTTALDGLPRLTEEALRNLNNPLQLSSCSLGTLLPRTLAPASTNGHDGQSAPTFLERAQVLRGVIVTGIERLRPAQGGNGTMEPAGLHYEILWREYVMGMSAKHVMVRLSLPESTFHRYRRAAVAALARELKDQEEINVRAYERSRGGDTGTVRNFVKVR
jgi:hypothetical protein